MLFQLSNKIGDAETRCLAENAPSGWVGVLMVSVFTSLKLNGFSRSSSCSSSIMFYLWNSKGLKVST